MSLLGKKNSIYTYLRPCRYEQAHTKVSRGFEIVTRGLEHVRNSWI